LKKSYSPRLELSNDLWHATFTKVNQDNSRLLVVGSQIGSLIFSSYFGHSLCFEYPNGLCELNLNVHVSRALQWYKYFVNPMSFDPCNCPLKIWKSIEIPTPKVGAHLGVCGVIPSHSPTLLRA